MAIIPGSSPTLPANSLPYGNQQYKAPDGSIWSGSSANGYFKAGKDIDVVAAKAVADTANAKADIAQEDIEDIETVQLPSKIPLTQKDAVGGVPSIDTVQLKMTIASLRALSGSLKSQAIYITDKGQEGTFLYNATDTTSADTTGTILVTSDGKRFNRVYLDLYVDFFGAKGDGVTNDTAAFNLAKAALPNGGEILCSTGKVYLLDEFVVNTGFINIKCNGGKSTRFAAGSNRGASCEFKHVSGSTNIMIDFNAPGLGLENIYLNGNNASGTALKISNGFECTLRNIQIAYVDGIGLDFEGSYNTFYENIFVDNCGNSTTLSPSVRIKTNPPRVSNTFDINGLTIERSAYTCLEINKESNVSHAYPEFIRIINLHVEAPNDNGGVPNSGWPLIFMGNFRNACFVDPFIYGGPYALMEHNPSDAFSPGVFGGIQILGGTFLGRDAGTTFQPVNLVSLVAGNGFSAIGTIFDNASGASIDVNAAYGKSVFIPPGYQLKRGPSIINDARISANRNPYSFLGDISINGSPVTPTLIAGWNTAFTNNHTHANKGTLDVINQNVSAQGTPTFRQLNIDGLALGSAPINYKLAGIVRNSLGLNSDGNTDYNRFDAAGVSLGRVFRLDNTTGVMAFSVTPTIPSLPDGTNNTQAINAAFATAIRTKYVSKTGSTNITPASLNETFECFTTTALTQTILTDATTLVGTIKAFKNKGTFPLTITPDTGVSIEASSSSIVLPNDGDYLCLIASAPNNWRVAYIISDSVNRKGVASSAATLTVDASKDNQVFFGSTATWTWVTVSGNLWKRIFVKNRGVGNLTINSNTGANDFYLTSAVNTLTVAPGAAIVLVNDGTYWNIE